jgi:hypothetical protein
MQLASRLVSTRRGTLLAALVIAMLAGASILLYLNSYRDSLKAEGAMVTVLVANQTIPKGTSGNVVDAKDLYTVTTIRESQLLEGAMSDPATLRDRVATREIFEGAQLTDRQRIVSLPFDAAHGLIGGIEPGNRVDVYAAFNVTPILANGTPVEGAAGRPIVRLILSDVPVVAVGEKPKGSSGKTQVSLQVDDVKAAQVAFGSEYGRLWLALRPSAGAKASRPDVVTIETLLLGIPSVQMLKTLGGRR